MALILCVETSSKNCSVAIAENGNLVASQEEYDANYCHGERLHVLIDQLLNKTCISINNIDALAFSNGPGSYTGLRIGAATIKGLSVALDKNVILVSTLQSMVWGFLNDMPKSVISQNDYMCPLIDSRIGEVYAGFYDSNLTSHISPFPCSIMSFPFLDILKTKKIHFFGPGAYKVKNIVNHPNAFFFDDTSPSSKYLVQLAQKYYNNKEFADVAYFEPLYLKNFVSTKSDK